MDHELLPIENVREILKIGDVVKIVYEGEEGRDFYVGIYRGRSAQGGGDLHITFSNFFAGSDDLLVRAESQIVDINSQHRCFMNGTVQRRIAGYKILERTMPGQA
jgi:hypothetical protein